MFTRKTDIYPGVNIFLSVVANNFVARCDIRTIMKYVVVDKECNLKVLKRDYINYIQRGTHLIWFD